MRMQTFRPKIHFTPQKNWMNDPNGLVYFAGEYHMFYQHYPHTDVWGPMHWGHAVSTDLVHWEELPIALEPYGDTMIFSGSAVIDHTNSSGFGFNEQGDPPMVAIYTSHFEKDGRRVETQSIAYSHDRGRSFTRYEGNPVLAFGEAEDFRDPKVFWYEDGAYWLMSVVAFDHVRFYKSLDLKQWTLLSTFGKEHGAHGGVWECPDLVRFGEKWVLLISVIADGPNKGSAMQYFVGTFDGVTFTNDNPPHETRWLDYGADYYAGVTWTNNPDGRVLSIAWMNNWDYARLTPSVGFRGAMTCPRELTLEDGRLIQKPVGELLALARPITRGFYAVSFPVDAAYWLELKGREHADWTIRLQHGEDEETTLTFQPATGTLTFDRSISGNVDFHPDFARVHTASYEPNEHGDITVQILLDASSIEVFINGGKTVLTNQIFPSKYKHTFVRDGISVEKLTLATLEKQR